MGRDTSDFVSASIGGDPHHAILESPPQLSPSATVADALALIRSRLDCSLDSRTPEESTVLTASIIPLDSGCVLVTENHRLLGIITERDLVRLSLQEGHLETILLSQVMTAPVLGLQRSEFTNIFVALNLMKRQKIRHLPILEPDGFPSGLATISSLRRQLGHGFFLRFRLVHEIMTLQVVTVSPHDSLAVAVQRLCNRLIGSVVVVDPASPSDSPVALGILAEGDVLQLRTLGLDFSLVTVGDVMSTPHLLLHPEDTLGRAHELMSRLHVKHLMVTNSDGSLAGIVSEGDLVSMLDPIDLYGITEILQQQVQTLREARDHLLSHRRLDLEMAFQKSEFRLVYQPQLQLSDSSIRSSEALLRRHSPKHGTIPPAEFIPLAEQTDFICDLGKWALEQACRQTAEWNQQSKRDLSTAVNVSSIQLQRSDFVSQTLDALERTGLEGRLLKLELTESALVENITIAADIFLELQSHGIQIAIDDFGTGYASLAYLQHFSFDILKLDASFISGFDRKPKNQAIVKNVIELAQTLHFQVVAEGVESTAELELLRQLGCHVVQGYLISRPLEVVDWSGFWQHPHAADQGNGRAVSSTASGGIHMASP
ncbi:MAG: EAL domain-containing protein [Cyanobium sp. CZS 25K]|nr:EAL domain-containing protein [Cyanobium sp. CZS25K]